MKLIEGWSGNLPMCLFIQVAQRHGVSQQEVELLGHFEAHRFLQLQRQHDGNRAISLNLFRALMKAWLCGNAASARGNIFLRHFDALLNFRESWFRVSIIQRLLWVTPYFCFLAIDMRCDLYFFY